ncbi:hypothetical protein D3C79_1012100 [compost metagenome]
MMVRVVRSLAYSGFTASGSPEVMPIISEPPSFGASFLATGAAALSLFLASSQPAATSARATRTADTIGLRISH